MLTLWQCRALNNWCVDVKVWCLTRGQIEPAGSMPLPISRLPALCATQHSLLYTLTCTHTHLTIHNTSLPMGCSTSSLKPIVKPLRYLLQDSVTVTRRHWPRMFFTSTFLGLSPFWYRKKIQTWYVLEFKKNAEDKLQNIASGRDKKILPKKTKSSSKEIKQKGSNCKIRANNKNAKGALQGTLYQCHL